MNSAIAVICTVYAINLPDINIWENHQAFFSFYHVNPDKMLKIIENTDSKKATQQGDIPVRIIKEILLNNFSKILSEMFNF